MKRTLITAVLLFTIVTCSSSQHIGIAGNLYAALQNWSKVGDGSDSKLGFGAGGMIGLALSFDSTMTFSAGPHFAYNAWTADYSQKSQSFTETVVLNMEDTGVEFSMVFDDIGVFMGVGKSKMEHYMKLKSGTKVPYYGLDGKSTDYKSVGFTFAMSPFLIGAGYTSYADFAKDASRLEIRIGLTL